MVPHLGGVVEHASLLGVTGHGGDGVLDAFAVEIGAFHQLVEVVHVGSVVLAVVELQGLPGDMGLESIELVRQSREGVGHERWFGRRQAYRAARSH